VKKPEGVGTFHGYTRAQGPAGIRNHLLVLPAVACANGVVRAIGRAFPEAVTLEHAHGCGRAGDDHERTIRVLRGCGMHPNVGAVLVVALGCEGRHGEEIAQAVAETGRPVEHLGIQEIGGTRRCTERGVKLARQLWAKISAQGRESHPLGELSVGLQCGGSDALSGVTANPAVGRVSDRVVAHGGTAILAETTEMIGTTHILQARAVDSQVAEAIGSMIGKNENLARQVVGDGEHMVVAPGNMEGGLSSIAEKSLGCIAKGGDTPIQEVVAYAEIPDRRGLVLMDTPGYDVESLGGLVAAGCQLILFTTGRGNPIGTPLAPVVKLASNSPMYNRMMDDMDINAGQIADGEKTLVEMGRELWDYVAEVLDGRLTKAEENEQDVIGLSMTMESF
jgi:altronate dehydratase large subunit